MIKTIIHHYVDLQNNEREINRWYGHDYIIKKYAKVYLPYEIPGELQHGWYVDDCLESGKPDLKQISARYYVWNRRTLELSINHGFKNVTAIGAPFIYLSSKNRQLKNSYGQKSLILFPVHSFDYEPFIDPLKTYEAYLKEIKELYNNFNPITICLYWREFENTELRKFLINNNSNVVTMGHRDNNPRFLYYFNNIVNRYSYVSSNVYSSAIFYSSFMRKKVFIYGNPRVSEIKYGDHDMSKIYDHNYWSKAYPEIVWENFDDKSHYWIGEKELGYEFKKSPGELRRIFNWDARDYINDNLIFPIDVTRKLKEKIGER